MVFIGFALVLALLGASAELAGGVGNIINIHSIVINIVIVLAYVIAVNGWKMLGVVFKMFLMNNSGLNHDELEVVTPQLSGLIYVNIVGGLLSMTQGMYSGIAHTKSFSAEIFHFSSITVFYALIISFFVFYPIMVKLKNEMSEYR